MIDTPPQAGKPSPSTQNRGGVIWGRGAGELGFRWAECTELEDHLSLQGRGRGGLEMHLLDGWKQLSLVMKRQAVNVQPQCLEFPHGTNGSVAFALF